MRECAQCASHARASQQGVAESDVGNISKPASRFERGIYQNNRTDVDKVQKVVIRTLCDACEILEVEVNVVFSASSGEGKGNTIAYTLNGSSVLNSVQCSGLDVYSYIGPISNSLCNYRI